VRVSHLQFAAAKNVPKVEATTDVSKTPANVPKIEPKTTEPVAGVVESVLSVPPPILTDQLPFKRDAVQLLDRITKQIVDCDAVLENRRVRFSHKSGELIVELDLSNARKLTKMGTFQNRPFCLALTVLYDTHVIWCDELELDNWVDAIVHSSPDGMAVVERNYGV
jgi:hypothetical protein